MLKTYIPGDQPVQPGWQGLAGGGAEEQGWRTHHHPHQVLVMKIVVMVVVKLILTFSGGSMLAGWRWGWLSTVSAPAQYFSEIKDKQIYVTPICTLLM